MPLRFTTPRFKHCENVDSLLNVVPPLQYMSTHVFMYVKAYSKRNAKGATEQPGPPNLLFRICARTSVSCESYGHHMQHFPASCAYEPCDENVFKVHSHNFLMLNYTVKVRSCTIIVM